MFVIEVPFFDLDQIYNSKQCPRWIKLKEKKYVIPYKDKALKIEQIKSRLIMSCTEDEFYSTWFNYFDLKTDYMNENRKIKKANKKFKVLANRGSGIHILNQDIFESYIFCKLVHNLSWDKACEMINRIAACYGIEHKQSMREAGKVTWYEFPTPESLLESLKKEKIKSPIKRFLLKLSNAIVEEDFDMTQKDDALFKILSLHDTTHFPTIEIEQTLEKNFKCDVNDFEALYLSEFNFENYALLYFYILHHIKNLPKEMK